MAEEQGKIYFGTGIDNSGLKRDAQEAKTLLHDIGASAETEGRRIDETCKTIGKTVAGVFAVSQLKDFVVKVAQVRGEFQQLEIAFKTMLGSEERAAALMTQLTETAAKTPFGMNDIAQASKQLLAYGVEAEDVNETLIRLGDIAAGLSIPIGDLAYLYGTTMVQGRLFTQDLRQFTGRGIPLTEELAKQFGVTKDKVAALVTEGKVGFPEVQQAIISLTSEGGKFGGLMAAQSQTITGQISNIEDSIEQMFNTLGQRSEGVISDTLDVVSNLVDNWETVGKVLLTVISSYGAYKAAVIAIAAAHKIAAIAEQARAYLQLTKMITSAKDAMLLLNMATKANPIGLVVSVVATAATAFALFRDTTDEAAEAIDNEREEALEFEREVGKAAGEMTAKYRQLQSEYKQCKDEHEKREWITKSKDKFSELGISVGSVNTAENVFVRNTEAMMSAFKKRAEVAAYQSKLTDTYAQRIERQMHLENEAAKIAEGSRVPGSSHTTAGGNEYVGRNGEWVYTAKGAAAAQSALLQNDILLKSLDAKIDQYAAKVQSVGDEYAAALKLAADNSGEPTEEELKAADEAAKTKQKAADEAAERASRLQGKNSLRAMAAKEAALAVRDAEIDGMKEGYAKEEAEAQLEYDRLMLANEKRQNEMVERLKDIKVLEWRRSNPNGSKADELAYRDTVTAADLSKEEKDQLAAYAKYAADEQTRRNRESLETMLSDVRDYNQQREVVDERYYDDLSQMYTDWNSETKTGTTLRAGVSQGNVSELSRNRQDALEAIDEEFASRSDTYEAWCESIADMSLAQLRKVLEAARKELADLEKLGTADSSQLAEARAKVTKAQKALNEETAKQDVGVKKRTVKEWEDLYKTLGECVDEFEAIGDAVGGAAGEAISAAGKISTSVLSMINSIEMLAQGASAGMKSAATEAAQTVKTVERASMVLTVISAAISAAKEIADIINADDLKDENIESLQSRIDELEWQRGNEDVARLQENESILEKVLTERAMSLYANMHALATAQVVIHEDSVKNLAQAYSTLAYTADKALGNAKWDGVKEQLENIAEQQLLIAEQADNERSKKNSDDEALEEYEQKIEELGEESLTLINDIVEEIVGGSATDIATELGDAFIEAFQNGEDAAEAWGDKVNDIVADVLKRMLIQKFLEEPLGEIFNKYKAKWFPDGTFAGIDAVLATLSTFSDDLKEVGEGFAAVWDAIPEDVKALFKTAEAATREASSEGIATASQESVDELNGRMTAVQGHTYSISENMKLLVANTGAILTSVLAIEANTDRLAAVEANIKAVKDTLNDISLKGLKIK